MLIGGNLGNSAATAHLPTATEAQSSADKVESLRVELNVMRQRIAMIEDQLRTIERQAAGAPNAEKGEPRQVEPQNHGSLMRTDAKTARKMLFISSETKGKLKEVDMALAKDGLDGFSNVGEKWGQSTGKVIELFSEFEELFDPSKVRTLYLKRMELPLGQKFISLSDFEDKEEFEEACVLFGQMTLMDQLKVTDILEDVKSGKEISKQRTSFVFAHRAVFGIR